MVVSRLKCRSFIQIIIVGHLCTVICFEIGQINYGATLSLRAYRRRAQDGDGSLSFEMSAIIQIIIVGHLCTVICFEIGQIMGLPSPSELIGGAPKILR